MIPCYNEEQGLGRVIDNIPKDKLAELGYITEVLVIDNNSIDRTAEVALARGSTVVREPRQGKGHAVICGFTNLPHDADVVAMIDGDNSYDIRELPRLIEPLENNFGDAIVGTRLLGKLENGSMRGFNRFGNWLFTFLARTVYKTNVTDVCSGFFAWKKHVIPSLLPHLESDGFSIEMEMITKMAKMGYGVYSVPISYNERRGSSNLKPVKDGIKIIHAWFKNLAWKPAKKQKVATARRQPARS